MIKIIIPGKELILWPLKPDRFLNFNFKSKAVTPLYQVVQKGMGIK